MTFSKDELKKGLADFDAEAVEVFSTYCIRLLLEKDKEKQKAKNEWIQNYKAEKLINIFKQVAKDGLFIDGKNITLDNRGVSYNYKAYKNMLLIKYPETQIDHQLVYKDDVFHFSKQSGKVIYNHEIADPFEQKDDDVIGGYCVIKNRRGEFVTTMGKEDINKCRKVAKTDKIWKEWYKAMCLKTVIKSACSLHFQDIFQNILDRDNETENDIENPQGVEISDKAKIDEINDLTVLRKFYNENKTKCERNPDLLKYIQKRNAQLKEDAQKKAGENK
jgi:hypothetical protein